MDKNTPSPFLAVHPNDWLASNRLAFAIADGYPVSEGHILVVPKRHVASWFDATDEEQHALLDLVAVIKTMLDDKDARQRMFPTMAAPDGYNIGINVGTAGGQTVGHVHVHLIPRNFGDVNNPTGGVRNVIAEKGNYLTGRQKRQTEVDVRERGKVGKW